MKTWQVWHARTPNFLEPAWQKWPDDYELVARYETEATGEDAADLGFSLTNSTDLAWCEAHEDKVEVLGTHHRSTSVGDVVVAPDGTLYLVKPVGFEARRPL